MASEPSWYKGDRYPYLEGTVVEAGHAINAEAPLEAVSVSIRVKQPNATIVEKTAEWVNRAAGSWRYKWAKADVESGGLIFAEGQYTVQVIVEWESGVLEHIGTRTFSIQPLP